MLTSPTTGVRQYNQKKGCNLNLRVGISSGPVVGGFTGFIGRTFDVWGDSVNVASRMESSGVPGRIQVSGATYAIVNDTYQFETRRSVQVKGKGDMWCYLLSNAPDPRLEVLAQRQNRLLAWRRSLASLVGQIKMRTHLLNWVRRARKRIAQGGVVPTPIAAYVFCMFCLATKVNIMLMCVASNKCAT